MDTYTAIMSLGGIFALVGLVAFLTFFEEMSKWIKRMISKSLRKNTSKTRLVTSTPDADYHFSDREEGLFLNPKELGKFSKMGLKEKTKAL
jgi:hypothetical protein